ncbi:hypothetical protein [Chryseobacterium rhizosphaerae]|uniref:Uncharacterized protein n=1 Tax=Chryseobacterium rhizosphaerae TaxID=395937 RepID=A0ABX9ILD6_9FLAO|nr:hypothetical protein [Chryseobacterium rhizosphaerae]REC75890.1 hypothetical protein DRF57_08975 [Chryseobacterium rhizosphaerae]
MKTLIIMIMLGVSLPSLAQTDTISNKQLKKMYYDHIGFLIGKKSDILKDNTISNYDLKNVIALKQNEYEFISQIKDTVERKRIMTEETRELSMLKANYINKAYVSGYIKGTVNDFEIYNANLDSLKSIKGLEPCPKCAISRKVKFIVLKSENNKIDTLKCAVLKYTKVGFQNRKLSETEFNSFPCDDIRELSLSGSYGKNIIEIFFEEKKYRKEFILTAGRSANDICILPIVLDKKYLIYDN